MTQTEEVNYRVREFYLIINQVSKIHILIDTLINLSEKSIHGIILNNNSCERLSLRMNYQTHIGLHSDLKI